MRLKDWQKILYAAGSLGVALSYQAFGTYIQFFYIDILGVKADLVGGGWFVYGLWNMVNDPLAGYVSDNTRTRWGRRIPWIAGLCLPLGLFFYLLWMPPALLIRGGQVPLFVYFMAVILIFDLLWTFGVLNWTALFPEMIPDEKERAVVSGWRQLFSVIGGLAGIALVSVIVGADWSRRGVMALVFGAITALAFALSVLGSRENPAVQQEKQPPFRVALRTTFQSRAFRWFMAANLSKEFIIVMITASIPFWAKYVLRIQGPAMLFGLALDVETQNSVVLGLPFIVALPSLLIWTTAAKRRGGRRSWQIAQAAFALSLGLLFFAGTFAQGAAATAVLGVSLAGLLVLPDLLIADVIDEDETISGARREGMYFGINGLMIRLAVSLQGIVIGRILSFTGYVPSTEAVLYPGQPAVAVFGMRAMLTLIPILASLVVIWALSRYPLHGARLADVRHRLAALHPSA
jgi:GPH family glycoside/pentoside/hexuronide:cation symporter